MEEIHRATAVPAVLSFVREATNALFDVKRLLINIQPDKVELFAFGTNEKAAVQDELQKMINYLFDKFPTAAPKSE